MLTALKGQKQTRPSKQCGLDDSLSGSYSRAWTHAEMIVGVHIRSEVSDTFMPAV
jgi:hypothetical protein